MTRATWLPLLALALLLAALAAPLAWALFASLRTETALFEHPLGLPAPPTLQHYRALFAERDFWTPVRNSLIVAAATTLLCVPLGALAAYAIARLRFPGRTLLLMLVLATTMFPQISVVAPLYLLLRATGLVDTFPGLVLPYTSFALPLTVWLLTGLFSALPADLEDAARVDGAGRLAVLREIVLPLAAPGLATAAVVTFIFCWNEFLFALSFTVGPERHTVPVAIALFRGQHQVPWGQVLAAAIVSTLPVALLVLFFQRHLVRGLTAGAVKG